MREIISGFAAIIGMIAIGMIVLPAALQIGIIVSDYISGPGYITVVCS